MSRKFEPQILYARQGEKFLFQFGEDMRIEEVPEGTRIIYPGVRAEGERNRRCIEERLAQALDHPTGTPPCARSCASSRRASPRPRWSLPSTM